jgi:hypothetical protein
VTVYPEPNSSQVRVTPAGGRAWWLSHLGHMTGLKTSTIYPGGCDKMSCLLEVPASYRHQVLSVGAVVEVFRGGHKIWDGLLDEPKPSPPSGWDITAVGSGLLGEDFLAVYSTAWPGGEPDEIVNNARGRGLNWDNPGIGSPSGIWLGQAQDSASRSVKEVLDMATSRGGLGWYVNSQPGGTIGNTLTVAALPAAPTRMLVCSSPVPRTMGGDVRSIYIRYCTSADNVDASTSAAYATTSVVNTGHGGREFYLDLANAGVLSQAAAQAVATQVLKIYQRASFAGPFEVTPGMLLTMGGVPVDPACEQAGFVCRVIMTDYAYGAEVSPFPIQFLVAGYEWDDHARVGSVTPYQTLDSSLTSLLSATGQAMTPMSVA